jgi:signal transduction histidine kinase
MGLGLAICRMIVDRHGGKLSALSDGKNGARFQIVLPVGLADSG